MQSGSQPLPGSEDLRRRIAAAGLLLGPASFAAGEIVHHQSQALLPAAAVSLLGLYFCIGGILGLVHLLRPGADRLGLVGGAVALLGVVAVSNIMLIQLVFGILDRDVRVYPDAVAEVFRQVLFVTYLFGPALAAGLFLLALGLLRVRAFPTWIALSFLLGASTFPAGRIGGLPWLIHVSDLVLTAGAIGMGWHLWRHPALWDRGQVACVAR